MTHEIKDNEGNVLLDKKSFGEFNQALKEEVEKRFGNEFEFSIILIHPQSTINAAAMASSMDTNDLITVFYAALGRALYATGESI